MPLLQLRQLATVRQALLCVIADELQQAVADGLAIHVNGDQRLGQQLIHEVQHVGLHDTLVRANSFSRCQIEATSEHR